ncbi:MAG: putative aminopeptidase [bacterium]|jgi:predicted aminopeptidase
MFQKHWRKTIFFCILVVLLFSMQSCYLYQQGKGQLSLVFDQIPIKEAIQQEKNPKVKKVLQHIPNIKKFAENVIGLKRSNNYSGYYKTEEEGVSYIVTASYKTKFKPYTWWFPVIGTVPYKGFFDKKSAFELKKELEKEGFDTYIFPAPAYSTLGWFKDPVTSPMIKYGLYFMTNTIIHELTHLTIYINGQGNFNEQLASFVGKKGAEQYFNRFIKNSKKIFKKQKIVRNKRTVFYKKVRNTIKKLDTLYQSSILKKKKLQQREILFQNLASEIAILYPNIKKKKWVMNNARLLQYRRYQSNPLYLEKIWKQSKGNWKEFWIKIHQFIQDEKYLVKKKSSR